MVEPHSEDGPFGEPKLAWALAIVVAAMIVGGVVAIALGRMSWTDAIDEHERAREQLQSMRPEVPGSSVPRSSVPRSSVPRSSVPRSSVPGSSVAPPGSVRPTSDLE